MGESFKFSILEQAKWILGTRIEYYHNGSIRINQEKYLTEMLKRFNMENSSHLSPP